MSARTHKGKRPAPTPVDAPPPELIHTADAVRGAATALARSDRIAFDTEFLREKTFFPQLGLLQVADREKVWLIDPLELTADELQPLLDILVDPKILKVAHAAEQDQECLFSRYGVVAAPLFDTAVGAALTGRGDQVGLAVLLRKMLGVNLPKTHTRTDWLKRPLPEAMIEYAALDVQRLVEVGDLLLEDLERRGRRGWALKVSAEMADAARYETNGRGPARKIGAGARLSPREFAVLKELSIWRERRVRKSNIPRRWLAEDQVLVQLARARPTREEDLSHFRGLGARVRDYGAAHILAAVQRGLEVPEGDLEAPPEKLEPTAREAAALPVLKCFLNVLAQENDVPLRYLIDNDTPLLLLRGRFDSIEDLRASNLLNEGALEVFGEEILGILGGRRAIRIERGRAVRFEAEPRPRET